MVVKLSGFCFLKAHQQIKNYLKIIVVVNISYTYINIKAVTLTSGNTKKRVSCNGEC